MADEINKNAVTKADVSDKKGSDKNDKSDGDSRGGIGGWFSAIKAEFKKIIWPNRKELVDNTITVIVTSAIIAACVFIMDFGFSNAYNIIIDFARNFTL